MHPIIRIWGRIQTNGPNLSKHRKVSAFHVYILRFMSDVTKHSTINKLMRIAHMSYKGFTKLPNEVLEQIALAILDEKLDDHAEEGDEDEGDDKQRHRNGTCHLATFARLDKHIYEVATPLLYNKIDVSTSVARPLLETVLKNKKLAELVREITFTFSGFLEDGSDYHSETLTTTQMTLFGRALQDALAGTMRYDGRDPTALLDGDSPAAEAGLLLHALPNLVSMHFGDYESETFHSVFRCYRDISSTVFRRCIAGIFSENPRAVPAAMLSLETFDLSGSLNGRDGGETVWDIDWVSTILQSTNFHAYSSDISRWHPFSIVQTFDRSPLVELVLHTRTSQIMPVNA